MTLDGERLDLVRNAADTAWVTRRNSAQLEVRAHGAGSMVMYDGEGRTYHFSAAGSQPGSRLIGGNLYLLRSISGSDGNDVHFEYGLSAPALPGGGTGLAINLASVRYNTSPTTAGCYKNSVLLDYDAPATSPLAITMLGGTPLVRVQKVFKIFVFSSANCTTPPVRLRLYHLNYQPDPDTQLPRLQSVTMNGQQGTPEGNVLLPVAAYTYDSVVDVATHQITYQETQTRGPPFVIGAHHYAFGVSFTGAKVSSEPHASGDVLLDLFTNQAFIELNGDGRPDFLSEAGFYKNVPGPNGTTGFAQSIGFPVDAREKIHSAILKPSAGAVSAPYRTANTVVNDTLRQLIDMNGDGRLDVVETVLPDTDHWIIHLNKPDPTDPTKSVFVDMRISVKQMRLALNTTGLQSGRVPLAREDDRAGELCSLLGMGPDWDTQ